MKRVAAFLIVLASFIFSEVSIAQDLKVKFFNKTNYDIDALTVDKVDLGKIGIGDSAEHSLSSIWIQDGDFRSLFSFKIDTVTLVRKYHMGCVTGLHEVTEGYYEFDIELVGSELPLGFAQIGSRRKP